MPSSVRARLRDASKIRRAPRAARPSRLGQRGQAMLEFALIAPVLMLVIVGIIEFALAFNATLGINRASQVAALVAAEAGNLPGADCLILSSIESDVGAPSDRREITGVEIQRTNPSGVTVYARNSYVRGGVTNCTLVDGTTMSVPYTVTTSGYPVNQRCNVLKGCPLLTPARTTVDTIGIQVSYAYHWRTPLGAIMQLVDGGGPSGTTFAFDRRSAFRMEPQT
jgi:Flp pilus assembly protein TadG